MKPRTQILAALAAALGIAAACTNLNTQTFRTEQAIVGAAYTAYVGWSNTITGPLGAKITPAMSNDVKQARIRLAESVLTVDALRNAYSTNSAVEPQLNAALDALSSNATGLKSLIDAYLPKGN